MAGPPTPCVDEIDRRSLRAHLRKQRDAFVSLSKMAFVPGKTLRDLLAVADCVGSYVAVASEVDPSLITSGLGAIALPRVAARDSLLTFHRWRDGDLLERSSHGFSQPPAGAEKAIPEVILTPLLGFDRAGHRLGQGGGHYDRYFASNVRALRIGISWSAQEVVALPTEWWDMPLDAVATEREWIVPAGSRLN